MKGGILGGGDLLSIVGLRLFRPADRFLFKKRTLYFQKRFPFFCNVFFWFWLGSNCFIEMIASWATIHRAISGEGINMPTLGTLINAFFFADGVVAVAECIEKGK